MSAFNDRTQIEMKKLTLEWDIEYWESYVYSYQNNEIQGGTDEDYKQCLNGLEKAKKIHNDFITEHSEELI